MSPTKAQNPRTTNMDYLQDTFILPPAPIMGREEYLKEQQRRFAEMMKEAETNTQEICSK